MVGAVIILGVLAILYGVSVKYIKKMNYSGKKDIFSVFAPMSWWLLERLKRRGINLYLDKNAKTLRNESLLGEGKSNLQYTVRKLSQSLAVLTVASILTIAYSVQPGKENIRSLVRPDYGMEPTVVDLEINGIKESFEVQPVLYDLQTVEKNFELAYMRLLEIIKGDNQELSLIRENLNLVTYLEEYGMSISWYSDKYELVDEAGNVHNHYFSEEQEEKVVLTATLSCQDYSCIYEIDIVVCAPILEKKQRKVRMAAALIEEYNREQRLEKEISLPDQVDGETMVYRFEQENYEWLFVMAGIAAGIITFMGRDADLRKLDEKRRVQMLMDYPEIVSKLTILLGAGMSVRLAWEKIVGDYRKRGIKRYAYEEMVITYNEIRAGTMESIAYSNFGKRCNIHEYLKFGAVLEQNVRSGTKGLAAMLENEAWLAFEVRKNTAVKLGEEAGTKLLLPMIMMLGVVLVIVMVPALMSLDI